MPDKAQLEIAKAEAAERERVATAERLAKARWLWRMRRPIEGSIAATYLRGRGYGGALPGTLGFLPEGIEDRPAMIAAFGIPDEPSPGLLVIPDAAVRGIHLTFLAPDGSKSVVKPTKKMRGSSAGWPIVLAPPNDLLALAVTEGIEDALSAHAVMGGGAWAAGCASRMPGLVKAVPDYIEAVTVLADADTDGQHHGKLLAKQLRASVPNVRLVSAELQRVAA
jgi:hypothetical protein